MEQLKQLTSFESACKVLKLDPKKIIPDFKNYPVKDRKSMVAHAKLVIIIKAANLLANGGKVWKPDFDNKDQIKYEIWWYKAGRGPSGFQFYDYDLWVSHSGVGSRLCFISGEVGKYVAEKFVKLWNEYLL